MKTMTKKFPLTTFIKNVQSTIRKVGEFALNNVEYLLVGIGIAAKMHEAIISSFNMPLSFYTDMVLDVFLIWGWINYLKANHKILRHRLTTCALNFNQTMQRLINLQGLNINDYNLRKQNQQRLLIHLLDLLHLLNPDRPILSGRQRLNV